MNEPYAYSGHVSVVSRIRPLGVVLLTAAAVVLVDQLTKWWAQTVMAPRIAAGEGPIEVVGSLLKLTYAENTGAAFSLGTGYTWIFTGIAVVVVIIVVRVSSQLTSRAWALALGGLLGGALGNLVDRLFRAPGPGRGFVVDFIALPYWPVFNVADMAIFFSAIAMVVLSWKNIPLKGAVSAPGGSA